MVVSKVEHIVCCKAGGWVGDVGLPVGGINACQGNFSCLKKVFKYHNVILDVTFYELLVVLNIFCFSVRHDSSAIVKQK